MPSPTTIYRFWAVLLAGAFTIFYLEYSVGYSKFFASKTLHFRGKKRNNISIDQNYSDIVNIFMYNNPGPGWMDFNLFQDCPAKCRLVLDTKWTDIPENSVVLFHVPTLDGSPPPKRRGQVWIFFDFEAPPLIPNIFQKWKGVFNWTVHYRRDSDFFRPYGGFTKTKDGKDLKFRNANFASKEKKLNKSIAWFVSNCNTQSIRRKYVSLLSRYSKVDIYGRCGPLKCGNKGTPACVDMLSKYYTYYLSFENAFCKDYITEKSFKLYPSMSAIPVVRGYTGVHEIFLPPNSYINANDFNSTFALSRILKQNLTTQLFEGYFKWRKYYTPSYSNNVMCLLCTRLHTKDWRVNYNRLYEDINEWIRGKNGEVCVKPDDFF